MRSELVYSAWPAQRRWTGLRGSTLEADDERGSDRKRVKGENVMTSLDAAGLATLFSPITLMTNLKLFKSHFGGSPSLFLFSAFYSSSSTFPSIHLHLSSPDSWLPVFSGDRCPGVFGNTLSDGALAITQMLKRTKKTQRALNFKLHQKKKLYFNN